jgi:hypothetical protein
MKQRIKQMNSLVIANKHKQTNNNDNKNIKQTITADNNTHKKGTNKQTNQQTNTISFHGETEFNTATSEFN